MLIIVTSGACIIACRAIAHALHDLLEFDPLNPEEFYRGREFRNLQKRLKRSPLVNKLFGRFSPLNVRSGHELT